ncbi:NADH-quinone oxidoreductase subunit A [Emticicia fluvialis]|uniref:NADH-quinone oxidoreductase subunit A n=1 Tax=Emticicia fluvialis TaxID=2974474 RepID=UPI0021658C4A|nr:NADH-quinone oxidoreductase subunit A [Emticicia fluvialis]
MLSDFGIILLSFIFAALAVMLVFGISRLLRPKRPTVEKLMTYESGEDPIGNANIRFNVRYYVVALIFILFDVELVFLFPWATVFGNKELIEQTNGQWGWFTLAEMVIFIAVLALGLAYVWAKGHLEWVRPEMKEPRIDSKVPMSMYENVNKKYEEK